MPTTSQPATDRSHATAIYPHTIDNGSGERLTFCGVRSDEQGPYLEIRSEVAPGAGPPMHAHLHQEEAMTVVSGTMAYEIDGEEERRVTAGESVSFAPGVAHRFWNAGEEALVCTGFIRPADSIEYFLTELFASTRRNGGKRPGLFDAAWLAQRYRSEFRLQEIPEPVQRLLFPVIVAAGRLLGWDRRFAGAPEPVQRGAAVR